MDFSVVNNVQMEVTIGGEREITSRDDDCMDGIEPLEQDAGVQCTLLGTFSIDSCSKTVNPTKHHACQIGTENINGEIEMLG